MPGPARALWPVLHFFNLVGCNMSTVLGLGGSQILVFALVLCRLCGLILTAPVIGAKELPLLVRALFAMAVTMLIAPLYWGHPLACIPVTTLHCLVLAAGEILIGAV